MDQILFSKILGNPYKVESEIWVKFLRKCDKTSIYLLNKIRNTLLK